jgi:D-alanyl-D-alanine carboxypeptidase
MELKKLKMKKSFIICLIFMGLETYAQSNAPIDLQNVLDTFILNHKIPAIAVGVVKLDTLICGVSGANKMKDGHPIQLSSLFHLGSNTKAITSFMAAKLVEEGKIRWNSKLIEVIPKLKKAMNPKFKDITLEQLFAHTAGIKAYTSSVEFSTLPPFKGNSHQQKMAFAAYTLAHDTLLTLGNYVYSNGGYSLAALMMEKVSKKTWEELIKKTFADLTISQYVIGFPNRVSANNIWGHWLNGTDTLQAVTPENPYKLETIIAPAGDISMNILDYSKFIQGHLQGLCGNDNYLKATSYHTMHFGKDTYALAWGNGKNANGLVSTHNGSAGTFYCHTMLYKEKKIAIIVITNAVTPNTDDLVQSMRRQLFNLYYTKN